MKSPFAAALILGLIVTTPTFAAEKSTGTKKKTGATPPRSKMIVIPPPADPAIKGNEPPDFISSEMSGRDLLFFTTVVDAGRLQALLVESLKSRAQSEQIKDLAGMLAVTQDQENAQVAKLAATKGWAVSTEPTAAQKAVTTALEKHKGPDFDKAVMDKVIAASQQSVNAYEAAAQSADADIKQFAEKILPLAKERLLLVQRMTGAGKAANQLLRSGSTPAPKKGAESESEPTVVPPIIPSKKKPGGTPAAAATPPPATPQPGA